MARHLSIKFASDCAMAASQGYEFYDEHEEPFGENGAKLKTVIGFNVKAPYNRATRKTEESFDGSVKNNKFDFYTFGGGTSVAARSTMGFVALGSGHKRNHALIAFRGSAFNPSAKWSAIRRDIYTDGAAALGTSPKGWAVHGGFSKIFKNCLPEIQEIFRRLPNGIHTVHCVGHSMGGALATLAAEHFIDSDKTPYLYSFGAPRVGLVPHTQYMKSKMKDRIFRYYYYGDPVTWLPMWPFVHLPGKRLIAHTSSFMGSHGAYFDSDNLILAGGGDTKLTTDQARAQAVELIEQGGSAGGGWGLESRSFRCFTYALNKILYVIGGIIGGLILLPAITVIDQIAFAIAYAAGKAERPLIIKWMVGAFKALGKVVRSVTIDLVPNLRYLLNLMFTQQALNAERELASTDRFVLAQGRRVLNPFYFA